jgi:pimeloyl-ACP methyl ester carboxylesterase
MTDRIDTGDGEIAWTRHGEGPPLLLVNGYAATGADWDPAFIAGLAEAFDVICPDNRGMGGSDLGAGPMTVDRLVEDLVDLLDALEIERAAVAGWSMGGFVAQALAAAHPSRVGGLVLLATAAAGPGSVSADPAVTDRLFDHSGTPREQASRLIGLLFPEGVAEEIDAEFGEVVAAARAALSPVALAAQEELIRRWHREPADLSLAAIGAPTLAMAGEEDVVIPPGNATLLASSIAGAQLELFPGAGHAFIAQEAQRASGSIREFLAAS